MQDPEVIVIGLGGVGSAVLAELARRGVAALGIEQFDAGHDRGSSHGETRLIRKAYFEHPDYVPLLETAYAQWRALQRRTPDLVFDDGTGLVMLARTEAPSVTATMDAARAHGLPIELVPADEAAVRWPALVVPEGFAAVFDPEGGVLRVEACVRAQIAAALADGAQARCNERVLRWAAAADGVEVETDQRRYRGRRLVIAAGPWSEGVLGDLGIVLEIRRKVLFWFRGGAEFALGAFPAFAYDLPGHFVYGFPDVGHGVKIADHCGGQTLPSPTAESALQPGDEESVVDAARRFLPGLDPRPLRHATCLYTMSADEHFVVDVHPAHRNVAFVAGLSGHGFKFAPVLAAAAADLALEGGTPHPVGFLSLRRFSQPG